MTLSKRAHAQVGLEEITEDVKVQTSNKTGGVDILDRTSMEVE